MKKSVSVALLVSVFFSSHVFAAPKSATVKATCRSVRLYDVSWYNPSVGQMFTGFTTFDGTSGVPLYDMIGGEIYNSSELRPRSGQTGVFEADYATANAFGNVTGYGSGTITFPTGDSDANGIPDFMQYDRAANFSGSGSLTADWPGPVTANLSANFSRPANSTVASYSATMTLGNTAINYTGTMETIYASGSISYSRNPNQMSFSVSQTTGGQFHSYSGSGVNFTVINQNQISLPQSVLTRDDGPSFTMYAATFNRVGKKYVANVEVSDGDFLSSWRDYTKWVFEIIDNNDWDGDGIPDVSDAPPVAPTISGQPQNRTVNSGSSVSFRVTAAGSPPPAYRWKKNGTAIPGATNAVYSIANAQVSDAGNYTVVVSNLAGAQTSSNATLVVCAFSLSSPTATVDFRQTTNDVTVTATGDCSWSVINTNDWISILSGAGGNGPGTVTLVVTANTNDFARAGFLTIAGKSFIVNQSGAYAPATMRGKTILMTVNASTGSLSDSGTTLFITSQSGNSYRSMPIYGSATANGAYELFRDSDSSAHLTFDNASGLSFSFESVATGNCVFTNGSGETQTGTFAVAVTRPDYNGDGLADLLWQHTNGMVRAWFLNGTSFVGSRSIRATGTGWKVVSQSDLNGDGGADFIFQRTDSHLAAWIMNGTNFAGAITLPSPSLGMRFAGVGDFNNDRRNDFVFQNSASVMTVWLMNGTNILGSRLIRNGLAATGWRLCALSDLNQDGQNDLVFQHSDGRLSVWFLNGVNFLGGQNLRTPGTGWKLVGLNDVNFDGKLDFLFQNVDGRVAAWLMDGTNFITAVLISNGQPADKNWRLVGPK
jgi:hypothetical protein